MAAQIKQEVEDPDLQLVIKKQKGKMTQMSIDLTGDISWSDDEDPTPPPPGATGSGASSSYHTPASSPTSVNNIATPGTSQTCHQNILSPTSTPNSEQIEETEDDRKNKRTLFVRNLPRDVTELQVNFSLK